MSKYNSNRYETCPTDFQEARLYVNVDTNEFIFLGNAIKLKTDVRFLTYCYPALGINSFILLVLLIYSNTTRSQCFLLAYTTL